MSRFRVGDRVRLICDEYCGFKNGDVFTVTYNTPSSDWIYSKNGENYLDLCYWTKEELFELVKEEETMPAKVELKKDWSIACHNEDTFNAIISLCKVLGYPISNCAYFSEAWQAIGPASAADNVCMRMKKERHFEFIEGFINWHFSQEKQLTEEQKEILELEKVIQSCKDQIEEASVRVKNLKEMKK